MLVGYMRVSTDGDRQTFDLQRDALLTAGVDERHLFEDRVSGSRGERAGLAKALAFIKSGDCLVVWKLDRLGRSLPHLLTTVSDRHFTLTATDLAAILRCRGDSNRLGYGLMLCYLNYPGRALRAGERLPRR